MIQIIHVQTLIKGQHYSYAWGPSSNEGGKFLNVNAHGIIADFFSFSICSWGGGQKKNAYHAGSKKNIINQKNE